MAASGYYAIGEKPASPWRLIAVASAAGVAAALVLTALPHNSQKWATAVTTAGAVRAVPVQNAHQTFAVEGKVYQDALPEDAQLAYFAPATQQSPSVPPLAMLTGVLALVAAAVWRFAGNSSPSYAMYAATAEQQRLERLARLQADERAVQERRQKLAREEAERRRAMQLGLPEPQAAPQATAAPTAAPSAGNDWEREQLRLRERRERMEREKMEAARREVQERLQRLQQQFGSAPQAAAPSSAAPAAPASAAAPRQLSARDRSEREKAERAQREVQERLERLKRLGMVTAQEAAKVAAAPQAQAQATSSAAPTSNIDWQARQIERERQEREKQERAQREVQERLRRLQQLK